MRMEDAREREVERKENGGPNDSVETENIFADELNGGRPKIGKFGRMFGFGIAEDSNIVRKSVEPDINNLGGVARDFNSPGKIFLWARNRDVGRIREEF